MTEASQAPCFSQNRHCMNWANAGNLLKPHKILITAEQFVSLLLDLVATLYQSAHLHNDDAVHNYGSTVESYWQS